MTRTVAMWTAVSGPTDGADDCHTDGIGDCVVLAIRADDEKGLGRYYFGHLTGHQYQNSDESKGDAVATLKRFFGSCRSNCVVLAAVNFQPEPDFKAKNLEAMRPRDIQGLVTGFLKTSGAPPEHRFAGLMYLNVPGNGAEVTLKLPGFTLHRSGPDQAGPANDIYASGDIAKYNNWPFPRIAAEIQRRAAPQESGGGCTIV